MMATLIAMSRMLAIAAIAVLLAMVWDFCVGLRKAVERGEARTSYGGASDSDEPQDPEGIDTIWKPHTANHRAGEHERQLC